MQLYVCSWPKKRSPLAREPPASNMPSKKTWLPPITPSTKRSLTASTLHHRQRAGRRSVSFAPDRPAPPAYLDTSVVTGCPMLSSPKNVSTSSRPSSACMRVCHLNLSQFLFKSGAAQSLGCGGPCCAAPCSRVRGRWVGAAVCDGWSGTCGASGVALLPCAGSSAARHRRRRSGRCTTCVEPAMARMLATLGGLDSSGVR